MRTYFFARERDPVKRAALQDKLLGDAKAFAASSRPETIKHGMNIGFLTPPPPGERRDVSMGMAQWISGLARLQNANETERRQILGASFLRGGSGAGGLVLYLLLVLVVSGGIYYLYTKSQKKV